jgi:outer membrane protein assembly factor BamB
MPHDEHLFTPDEVDEQIDWLERASQAQPPTPPTTTNIRVIQGLHRLYENEQADAHSVDTVWQRLQERGAVPASQRQRGGPERRARRQRQHDSGPPPQAYPPAAPARRGLSTRLVALAAAVLLVVVVSGLVAGLVLVRQHGPSISNQPTAKPGQTVAPGQTNTPAATPTATPVPLEQQTVYVASYNGVITALNASTGVVRWHYQSMGKLQWYINSVGETKPDITLSDGILYVGSSAGVEAVKASDGSRLWQAPTGLSQDAPFASNGMVYIGTSEEIVALDARTGKQLWLQNAAPPYIVQEVVDGVVYEGVGALRAFDASTGKPLWNMDAPPGTFWGASNGQVYIYANGQAGYTPSGPTLHVFNARDGSARWQFGRGAEVSILGVVNNVVYLSTFGELRLYALNASDGSVLWQIPNPGSESALFEGVIYSGNGNGAVTAVSANDGTQRWQAPVAKSTPVSLLDEGNRTLYVFYEEGGQIDAGRVAALNVSDGSVKWDVLIGPSYTLASIGVTNGALYLSSNDLGQDTVNTIYAFNTSDGSQLWKYSQAGLLPGSPID